jgi:polyhydroxybutyrate depolymerase
MRSNRKLWTSFIALSIVACGGGSVNVNPDGDGAGGTSTGTGGSSSGGAASGGARSGGASSGGAASGGATSGGALSGGAPSSGGEGQPDGGSVSGGGPSGGTPGAGGDEAVGGGTMSGGSGSGGGGGKPPAEPSAGCGKSGSALGSAQQPLTVSGHQYYVKLPTNYNADTPYPTIIMFNPTGNPIDWAEKNAGYETQAKDKAIRVYPHPANSSSGWGAGDVSFFGPLYDKITADYCMDKARVFAAGESSGGDFSSILGCEHADKVRAVAPCATKNVSQYPLNTAQRNCTGQVAAIIIHGKNDSVVGPENGPKTRDFYTALNSCDATSKPVANYTDTQSNCVLYDGCDDGFPVYWCQHTDPEYSNTNHGWPKFAAKMTWETFQQY